MIDEIDRLFRIILKDIPQDYEVADITFLNAENKTQVVTFDFTIPIATEQLQRLYTLITECYNSGGYMLIGLGNTDSETMDWFCRMFDEKPAEKHVYQFWHHNTIGADEQQEITDMIKSHDYDAFMSVFATYQLCPINNPNRICYFPDVIAIVEDDAIKYVSALEKENFDKITDVQVRCG